MKKSIVPVAVCAFVCGAYMATVSAAIVTVYENGTYNANSVGASFYGAPTFIMYDNFAITSNAVISNIEWFGGELDSGSYTGSEFFIYEGMPESSTLITNGAVIADRVNTGFTISNHQSIYSYSVSGLSIALTPGTYYLGLLTQGFGSFVSIGSTTGSPLPGDAYQKNGANLAGPFLQDYYFKLSTSVVPIPAAVWLFGSGLIGLLGIARYKKAA